MKRNKVKRTIWFLLFFIILLSGYSRNGEEAEKVTKSEVVAVANYLTEKYGDEFDWALKRGWKRTDRILEVEYTEYHQKFERAGLDLTPFAGERLSVYFFDLRPTCISDSNVQRFGLVVYRYDKEFVGDVLTVEDVVGGPSKTAGTAEVFNDWNCK